MILKKLVFIKRKSVQCYVLQNTKLNLFISSGNKEILIQFYIFMNIKNQYIDVQKIYWKY